MSAKAFVDTNILVYAHDRSAGFKHETARALIEQLWESGTGLLSTQVLQEFCVSVRRNAAHPLALAEIRLLIQDYLSWEVVVNAPEAAIQALELEARYKISFWDALILCAADKGGADILYSEDFSSGQKYGNIHAVNPFQK